MSGFVVRFVAVVSLLVFLGAQSSARLFWRPAVFTLPSNPNDKYYQAFQNVPPARDTANKLMTNFLHIISPRIKRQSSSFVEDIVVVMDGSGSVGSCEFEKGKKALKHIMDESSRPSSNVKYAAVTFSSSASVNFKFLPSSTAANEIMTIFYPGGSTNTQAGLEEAKRLFDDSSSGRRGSSRKMVFLVTDGQSNVQPDQTIPKAQALKNMGVDIFVVAIGSYISGIDEIVKVAGRNGLAPDDYLYRVADYSTFWKIVKLIVQQVSPGKYAVLAGQYDPPC